MIVTTSWDDGHMLDAKLAALLARYNVPGTFYVAPENRELAPDERLPKDAVKELSLRFEIGAHTVTHPRLSTISDVDARREIADSKTILEEWTGASVKSFCYPGGDYKPQHIAMVKDAGFALARTVDRFSLETGGDPFEMPTTVHAYRHLSDAVPIAKAASLRDFPKNYRNWDDLAIALFDEALAKENGLFHLWGHSWEIEKNGDWERLERVLKHISGRPEIQYKKNGELI